MTSAAPPTILERKRQFIADQTRLLSQPLSPSRTWWAGNSAAAKAATAARSGGGGGERAQPLPEKAVDAAVVRLNHRLQQHSWRVYSPAATRHVAEQIEHLYLRGPGDAARRDADDAEAAGLSVGADLADAEIIAALPPSWPSAREAESQPLEAARYGEQVARLRDLSARREEAASRVRRLRAMRAGLAPFRTDSSLGEDQPGGVEGVQQNLVTRDGELERELERMRILMARVGDSVTRLRSADNAGPRGRRNSVGSLFREGDAMVVDIEDDGRRKVADLLDRF